MIELLNEDCMNVMGRYPDNYFDLAIVDVPYGLNIAKTGKVGGVFGLRLKIMELKVGIILHLISNIL